ncbi:MAG: hypothetical protein R3E48_07825 [Burkholderiaceae bacterium]
MSAREIERTPELMPATGQNPLPSSGIQDISARTSTTPEAASTTQ